MKPLLLLLFILCKTSFASDLEQRELSQVHSFLTTYLKLNKQEERYLKGIKVEVTGELTEGLSGFSDAHKKHIRLSPDLKNKALQSSTLVHELIHQFYYRSKHSEEDWALEGVALLGEYLYLAQYYGKEFAVRSFVPLVNSAMSDSAVDFTTFERSQNDYGEAFLLFLFHFSLLSLHYFWLLRTGK